MSTVNSKRRTLLLGTRSLVIPTAVFGVSRATLAAGNDGPRGASGKSPALDVKRDFNAKADGATNDYDSFRAALLAAESGGGCVYVPAGTDRIDASPGPLTVPLGVTLCGEMGRRKGSRIDHAAGPVLLDISGGFSTSGIRGIVITGGLPGAIGIRVRRFDTRLDSIAFDAWTGDQCVQTDLDPVSGGAYLCHFTNIVIRCWSGTVGSVNYGIRCLKDFNASSISNFTINGAKVAGIEIRGGASAGIHHGSLENNPGVGCRIGLSTDTDRIPTAIKIDTIYCEGNGISDYDIQRVNGLLIDNLYGNGHPGLVTTPKGIVINGTTIRNVKIRGGVYSGHSATEIDIQKSRDVELDGFAGRITTSNGGGYVRRTSAAASSATSVGTTTTAIVTLTSNEKIAVRCQVFGDNGSDGFLDDLAFVNGNAPAILSQATLYGSPAARTYTTSGVALRLSMASGTYQIRVERSESI